MSDSQNPPDDDPIPLWDGPVSATPIIHESRNASNGEARNGVRAKRQHTRHSMENVLVCFSMHDASGRLDHVDCPLVDMSCDGVAIVYDRRTAVGVRCFVSYRTVSQQPVHVGGVVKNCAKVTASRFRIGVLLDRQLHKEEQKPAKHLPGRSVSPTHQGRRLRGSEWREEPQDEQADHFKPLVREPDLGEGPEVYDLTPE